MLTFMLNSSPIDERGNGALGMVDRSRDMIFEQSMLVSTATLRVATTRHCHTDRVSGDT